MLNKQAYDLKDELDATELTPFFKMANPVQKQTTQTTQWDQSTSMLSIKRFININKTEYFLLMKSWYNSIINQIINYKWEILCSMK